MNKMKKKVYEAVILIGCFLLLLTRIAGMDESADSITLSIILIQGFYIIDVLEQRR